MKLVLLALGDALEVDGVLRPGALETLRGIADLRIGGRPAAYHAAVEAAFRTLAAEEPHRVVLVDASGSQAEVTARLLAAMEDLL